MTWRKYARALDAYMQENPGEPPAQTRKYMFEGEELNLGTWLDHQKRAARGQGTSAGAFAAAPWKKDELDHILGTGWWENKSITRLLV